MSNGHYEVEFQKKKYWIKPDQISYKLYPEWTDNINNYFETVQDEHGINLILKDIEGVIIEKGDGNIIKIKFSDGRRHSICNIFIGDIGIIDSEEISERPVIKKTRLQKILNIFRNGN